MKLRHCFLVLLSFGLLLGCSTVQVAQLDTTLQPTGKIDFFKFNPLIERKYSEIAYLTCPGVTEANYTASLGKLMDRARKLGADALILQDPDPENKSVLSAKAVVYEPDEFR